MNRLKFLREQKAEKVKRISEINSLCEKEERARSEEEKTEWRKLEDDIADIDSEISDLEKVEARKAEEAKKAFEEQRKAGAAAGGGSDQGEGREKSKIAKEFRLVRAIQNQYLRSTGNGKPLDGLEREMHDQAVEEARNAGANGGISGVGIPSFLIAPMTRAEKRAVSVGNATSAGNLVETQLSGEFIPVLRPSLMTQELGARVMGGLSGNVDISRKTGETTMSWEGEIDPNAEGTPTTDLIELRPKRGGVTTTASKQLIIQSSFGVEQMLREDIENAIAVGIDKAAINGSGTAPEPRGILNTTGIGSVALGANGAPITYEALIDLKKAIAVDNALMGAMAFLSNPDVTAAMEKTPKQSTGVEGNFIKNPEIIERLIGYRYGESTQVPNNLTKGTGTNLSALIFGNWTELVIANWAGLDIVVDPFSAKKTAQVEITINSWWDVALRHAESFAAIQDITT